MDVHTAEQRSGNMAAIKGKNTKPEMVVRRLLHRLGYRYVLHWKKLPGKPDLVFTSRKKAIFVHGCFWHMHDCRYGKVVPATNTEFWQTKRTGNVARDQANMDAVGKLGWQVLIAWECEIRNPERLADRLVDFLREAASLGARAPRRRRAS
jgi:DNA mismatch endonuclease (patch repair protein)